MATKTIITIITIIAIIAIIAIIIAIITIITIIAIKQVKILILPKLSMTAEIDWIQNHFIINVLINHKIISSITNLMQPLISIHFNKSTRNKFLFLNSCKIKSMLDQ